MHGLQWDYSFPRSPHGDGTVITLLLLLTNSIERVLLQKVTVTQLVELNPKVHYSVHRNPSLDRISSPLIAVHTPTPCFFKIHFNMILFSTSIITYLLNYPLSHSLHSAGYSLKSWQSLSFPNSNLLSLWKPQVYFRAHKSPPLEPIVSQPNSIRPIELCLPKVHLNVMLLRASQPKPSKHPSPQPCVLHIPPTSSFSI
jgi:hypothetical protein